MGRRAAAGLLLVLVGGCREDVFRCDDESQCPDGGSCEASGFCSVLDERCPSGRRYAPLSGALSGECVSVEGTSTDAEGSTADSAHDSTSTGDAPPSPATSSDASGGETSTTGNEPLVFVDDDASDFGAGSPNATVFDDGLHLQPGATAGTFVSRVFDAGQPASWTALDWAPRAPYAKPLPDDGANDESYPEGNASMEANVLLLHFDIGVGLVPGDAVTESSGHGQPVTLEGMGSVGASPSAIFGEGIALTPSNSVSVDASGTDDFQFGTDDFTWSMWARTTSPCFEPEGTAAENQVYMGIEEGTTGGAHTWLGCYNPASTRCGPTDGDGRLGSTVTPAQGNNIGSLCGGDRELVDGAWHHLALVKRGHVDAALHLFFDGELIESVEVAYTLPILFSDERPFQIGRLDDSYASTVDLDEMAVFRRGLQPIEVADLHLRGALRLEFRVRACDTPSCDGVPFAGPGGDVEATFLDGPGGPNVVLEPLHGRYFQYEARFSRTTPLLAREPIVDEVRVTALAD